MKKTVLVFDKIMLPYIKRPAFYLPEYVGMFNSFEASTLDATAKIYVLHPTAFLFPSLHVRQHSYLVNK
jgi:hypothetical protein